MRCVWKSVIFFTIFMVIATIDTEARSENGLDSNQALDSEDLQEIQNSYYDVPMQQQNAYPSIPLGHLQMFIARYNRPTAYLPSASGSGVSELYRLPEVKRQVKYRQCYFNPISCFKK